MRSLAISLQKTEVFLRYGMSDDVLAQIGKGKLDVGYYIDATPAGLPVSGTPPERTIVDGKFQLAPLMSYDYRVIAPRHGATRSSARTGPACRPALARNAAPLGAPAAGGRCLPSAWRAAERVGFTDQEEAVIGFVESGICLGLARDGILDRITRKRDFIIADKVALTCDLSFACLRSRRHEGLISHAFWAMQAVWDLQPAGTAPIEAARRKGARR